jgi:hypothetical protein
VAEAALRQRRAHLPAPRNLPIHTFREPSKVRQAHARA